MHMCSSTKEMMYYLSNYRLSNYSILLNLLILSDNLVKVPVTSIFSTYESCVSFIHKTIRINVTKQCC